MPVLNKENKEEVERYKEFLNKSKYTRLTQTIEWSIVKKNWSNEIVYLEENEEIIAGMSILIEKIDKLKISFAYSPRGPVCDIYDIELVQRLMDEAKPVIKKYNAYCLKIDPPFKNNEELEKLYKSNGFNILGPKCNHDKVIQPQYDAILNIKDLSEEELIKSFSEKTRYNIRLSNRKGVKVRFSRSIEDLKLFYDLYTITTIRDKIGKRDFGYFERMLNAFDEEHLRIYISEHEGDSLSAAIAICYGPEMFYLYGASSNEKRNLMPNYAMQWEMIKWAIEKECSIYNFGGIINLDKNDGLYKFKTGFCREEGIFEYIGEIDKVYKKGKYNFIKFALPIIKKIRRRIRSFKGNK